MPPSALRRPVVRRSIIAALRASRCVVGAAGCSLLKLGYGQASPLAFRWLDGYVDFDDEQSLQRARPRSTTRSPGIGAPQLPDYVAAAGARRGRGRRRGDARADVRLGAARSAARFEPVLQHARADDRRRRPDADRRRSSRTSRSASPRPTRSTATSTCSAIPQAPPQGRSRSARSSAPRCCTATSTTAQRELVAHSVGALAVRRRARLCRAQASASRTCWRWCARLRDANAGRDEADRPGARLPERRRPLAARRATAATPSALTAHHCALRERPAQQHQRGAAARGGEEAGGLRAPTCAR